MPLAIAVISGLFKGIDKTIYDTNRKKKRMSMDSDVCPFTN